MLPNLTKDAVIEMLRVSAKRGSVAADVACPAAATTTASGAAAGTKKSLCANNLFVNSSPNAAQECFTLVTSNIGR